VLRDDPVIARVNVSVPGTRSSKWVKWARTTIGFRYFVNRAGEGVVLRDVGRIVYATVDQEEILFSAGSHALAFDVDVEASLCEALYVRDRPGLPRPAGHAARGYRSVAMLKA
jgi:hypothetical protein